MAKDLLRQTNLSIVEIAARSGYGTAIAFSRRFRFRCGDIRRNLWLTSAGNKSNHKQEEKSQTHGFTSHAERVGRGDVRIRRPLRGRDELE